MEKEKLDVQNAFTEKAQGPQPMKIQKIFCWAMENFDELKEICDDPNLALEDLPGMMAKAWEEENYTLFTLLFITKMLKISKENEEF